MAQSIDCGEAGLQKNNTPEDFFFFLECQSVNFAYPFDQDIIIFMSQVYIV